MKKLMFVAAVAATAALWADGIESANTVGYQTTTVKANDSVIFYNFRNDRARELAEEMERLVTVEELVRELAQDEEYIRETIRLSGNAIPYIEGYDEKK